MSAIDELDISGKSIKRGVGISIGGHILLLLLLVSLAFYSTMRVAELKEEKQKEAERIKKEKLEDAVAEQQLEQDIKEMLEAVNPEANAEEIKKMVDALEETMDTEKLKDTLIAAMDETNPDAQAELDSYLEQLEKELSQNMDEATELTEDDQLEQELLEELVYKDLPEIDNNLENALKRSTVKELIQKALADKVAEVADEAKSQLSRDAREKPYDDKAREERKQESANLDKQTEVNNNIESSKEELLAAADNVNESTKAILDRLKADNPFKESNIEKNNNELSSKLDQAEETFKNAEKEAATTREQFKKDTSAALDQVEASMKQNASVDTVKKLDDQVKKNTEATQASNTDESSKTEHTLAKLQQTVKSSSAALATKEQDKQDITTAAKKAEQSQAESKKAERAMLEAKRALLNETFTLQQKMIREAENTERKLNNEEKETLKSSIAALKEAVAEQKKVGRPSNDEQLEQVKESIKAVAAAQLEFAEKVNTERDKALAKTESALKELTQLSSDIKGLDDLNKLESEQVSTLLKEESIKQRISDKSDILRDALKSGTEEEKDQRQEDFKLDAKDAVAAAGKQGDDSSSSEEGEESDDSEKSKMKSLGKGLTQSLVSAVGLAGMGTDSGKSLTKNSEKAGNGSGIPAVGFDLESSPKLEQLKNKFRLRRLSLEEKKAILSKNVTADAPEEPPMLRFAKPTLFSSAKDTQLPSEDIFVGSLNKHEIAVLDPNRPRKSHPQFKDTDFCAVPYCSSIPVLDGDPSDWNLEYTRLTEGKDVFMQWRPDGMYVLAIIRDKSGSFESASLEAMKSNFWDFDCMEIWFDMKNSKSENTKENACQQFWVCAELPGVGRGNEMWEVVWDRVGYQAKRNVDGKQYVGSKVHPDGQGYTIEYFIPRSLLTNLNFFRAGQVIGFLYAINHNNNYKILSSSLRDYDPNFHYSSQPKSWGNLQLLGTDAALNTLTAQGEPAEYPTVEVSQSLGLMVNDPDSNTDIGAINSVTVRVRNRFGFDGRTVNEQNEAMGDWEDVLLNETGKNTGIFRGWVPTTLMPSSTGDEKLGVQPGDVIDVDYSDFVRKAGEYHERMHVEVQVVSPVYNVQGAKRDKVKAMVPDKL